MHQQRTSYPAWEINTVLLLKSPARLSCPFPLSGRDLTRKVRKDLTFVNLAFFISMNVVVPVCTYMCY